MQLLSPQDVKNKTKIAEESQKRTYADLSMRNVIKAKELNDLEAQIKDARARMAAQAEWLDKEVRNRREEVARLAKQREELMKPIGDLKEKYEEKLKKLEKEEVRLNGEQTALDLERSILFARVDALATRTDQLESREIAVGKRERGCKLQEAQVQKLTTELNDRMSKHTREIEGIKNSLRDRESQLSQTEYALNTRLAILQKDEEAVRAREVALEDKYKTLERSVKRLKK